MMTIESIEKANEVSLNTAQGACSPASSDDAAIEVDKTAILTRQRRKVRWD